METKTRLQRAFTAVLLIGWVVLVAFAIQQKDEITVDSIVQMSSENSLLTALMMLCLFAFKSITVVLWSALLYAASAILFPLPWAMLVNFLGTVVMISVPYCIGLHIDVHRIREKVENHKHASVTKMLNNQSTVMFAFFSRIIALVPSDLLGMYCGAMRKRFLDFLLGSILGMLPSMLAYTLMGDALTDPTGPQFIWSMISQVILTVASLILYWILQKKHAGEKKTAEG